MDMELFGKISPVSIRVIGFGKQAELTIAAIKALGYDGVSAELYSDGDTFTQTENDIMVVFLGTTKSERVRSIAKTFYDANVLTLAVLK